VAFETSAKRATSAIVARAGDRVMEGWIFGKDMDRAGGEKQKVFDAVLKPVLGMVAPPTSHQELLVAAIFIAIKQGRACEKSCFYKI
jgi:hypothetical protein